MSTTSWRINELIIEKMLFPKDWNTPLKAIFAPAKRKLTLIIFNAGIPILSISGVAEKNPSKTLGNAKKRIAPIMLNTSAYTTESLIVFIMRCFFIAP